MTNVVRLFRPTAGHASVNGASWWQIYRSRLLRLTGIVANKLRLPGAISGASFHDDATGRTITINVGPTFTVLRIDGRDYWFRRFSGRLDGTGSGGCG